MVWLTVKRDHKVCYVETILSGERVKMEKLLQISRLREDGGLVYGGDKEGDEKSLDSACFKKIEPKGFQDR